MHNRIFVTTAILCFATNVHVGAQTSLDGKTRTGADSPRIQKMIENLGSVSFAEREQASKDLEKAGTTAVGELKKALKHEDAEISARAGRLLTRIEEKALTDGLLAAKKVRLSVKDVSVEQAVRELESLSKYKFEIIGDRNALSLRKITLDTGEITFWEALEQLCDKGHMVEQVIAQPNQPINNRFPPQPIPQIQVKRTIVLASGNHQRMPVSFGGSIRVRAVTPTSFRNPNESQIMLELAAEPRLQGFGVVGTLHFDKAIDDQGQPLMALADTTTINPNVNNFNNFNNRIMIVNGQVVPFGGAKINLPRSLTVRFQKGAKSARSLKELSGKLIVQALSDSEPMVTVKNVRKAVGQTFKGKNGNSLQVTGVESIGNGAIRVQVTVDAVPEQNNAPQQNPWGGNVGVMVLNGNFNGMINGVQFVNGVPMNNLPPNFPKLIDVKGKTYEPEVNAQRPEVANGRVVRHATLTYRPQAAADQLVLFGQRTIHFSVPVALKNLPLQ